MDVSRPPELTPELVTIPAGPFMMGSDDGEEDERPAHVVDLAEFQIGVQPVTNEEYGCFIQESGHREPAIHELPLVVSAGGGEREDLFRQTGEPYEWRDRQPPRERLNHPVTLVRWEDATAYCEWLSTVSARRFRLPSEAEWEKACRGGRRGERYPWGERFDRTKVNFLVEPGQRGKHGTTPVRTHPPNGYGLFDAAGNVWEWVQDWYAADAYTPGSRSNPPGPDQGRLRIVRGGGWSSADVRMLRCSNRHKVPPDTYSYAIGFRVASSV